MLWNWCWRRLLRVPWTARRSNQSVLKEISPECSLESLKLKLQYFGHLMQETNSLDKTLRLGKIEGRRRRGRQRIRWFYGIINSVDMSLSKTQEILRTGQSMGSQLSIGHSLATEQQQLSTFRRQKAGFQIGLDPDELLRVLTVGLNGDSSRRHAKEFWPSDASQSPPALHSAELSGSESNPPIESLQLRWHPNNYLSPGLAKTRGVQSALITALLSST